MADSQMKPENIEDPKLTESEIKWREFDIQQLQTMHEEHHRAYDELDGMNMNEYYESNRKKDLSYIPPKTHENRFKTRTVSGITREKDTTLVSTALSMNFVPDITAFDVDDTIVQSLGDNMSDLIKKSREIEVFQKKRPIYYRELVSQGDVFVQELYVEDFREMPLKEVNWNPTQDKISSFKIKKRLQKVFGGCTSRLIQHPNIYLGSMRIEHIEDQDRIAIILVHDRSAMYGKYGTWERWKNVPDNVEITPYSFNLGTYQQWNIDKLSSDKVSEIMMFDKRTNRFQIYLNMVPMLPAEYPLTAIEPSGELPFAQGKLEPISNFALSKSQPSKVKVDQEVYDEITQIIVDAFKKSKNPPMGTNNKRVYSKNLFVAGKMTTDVTKNQFFPLLDPQVIGLTPADFSVFQLVKNSIDEKSVNDAYEGQIEGDPTATQVQQEKQQQMMKLGLAIDGFMNFERRMAWLRLYNILTNWTRKYDKDLDSVQEGIYGNYRSYSVETSLENGQSGIKMFRFTEDEYPPRGEQLKEERDLTKKYGKDTRVVYMDPQMLRSLKYSWFINVTPTPNNNDVLTQVLFIQNVRQALEIFGPEALNMDYLKQRFAILINEDHSKMFKKLNLQQELQRQMQEFDKAQAGGDKTGIQGGMESAAKKRRNPVRVAMQ